MTNTMKDLASSFLRSVGRYADWKPYVMLYAISASIIGAHHYVSDLDSSDTHRSRRGSGNVQLQGTENRQLVSFL